MPQRAPQASLKLHATNLVGIPTGLLASTASNAHPLPLAINGVREMNAGLFRVLAGAQSLPEAADIFEHYMLLLFDAERPAPSDKGGRRRFRSSYLKLLEGWGFDSNNEQGAVLKGWVESRFGIPPSFHKQGLGRYPSDGWMSYLEEKMGSRFHNNCINVQLDLLFEFCQWAITRFWRPGQRHVTLYRGVNRREEVEHQSPHVHSGRFVTELNNLVSFSFSRSRADEFGDWILEVQVPVCKLLFFNGLLTRHPLQGEAECLVIGGEYEVLGAYV
ncbi:MAG: NAD(+)--dinitrogen-reductase ADP-D-ribosyltransferase [Thermomicrobiales bacterium]|nr:MAG: NAD(+)--dinitrogen-reductase ADP-D-ribosyltransferase [Thermomicrobiales bacterium]